MDGRRRESRGTTCGRASCTPPNPLTRARQKRVKDGTSEWTRRGSQKNAHGESPLAVESFLNVTPGARVANPDTGKWACVPRNSRSGTETTGEGPPTDWGEAFANRRPIRGSVHKTHQTHTAQKKNSPTTKQAEKRDSLTKRRTGGRHPSPSGAAWGGAKGEREGSSDSVRNKMLERENNPVFSPAHKLRIKRSPRPPAASVVRAQGAEDALRRPSSPGLWATCRSSLLRRRLLSQAAPES